MASGGSVDNLDRIAKFENAISFTFVNLPDYLRRRKEYKAVRAIAILNRDVLQLVASEVSGIDEVTDLREAHGNRPKYRVYVGMSGSGTREAAKELLAAAYVPWIEQWAEPSRKINYQEAAEQLRRGELDAAIFDTGLKAPAVEQLLKEDRPRCRLIPLSEPVRDALVLRRGYEKIAVPAYERKANVKTVGSRVLIATHKNTQSWIVQDLVEAIERNRKEIEPFLTRIELPANETSALITETETLQEILQDVPLHDGMIGRSWTWARSVWVHLVGFAILLAVQLFLLLRLRPGWGSQPGDAPEQTSPESTGLTAPQATVVAATIAAIINALVTLAVHMLKS